MRRILLIVVGCFFASLSYGQTIGLGVGSVGINVKSNPQKDWRFIGRLNLRISDSPIVQPSVTVARQLVNEQRAKLYLGGGVSAQFNADLDDTIPIFVRIPVGVEYFLFEDVPVSVGAEAGLEILVLEGSVQGVFSSLLDFTYYFGN